MFWCKICSNLSRNDFTIILEKIWFRLDCCNHVFPIGSQGLAHRHYIGTIEEYVLTVDLLPTAKNG